MTLRWYNALWRCGIYRSMALRWYNTLWHWGDITLYDVVEYITLWHWGEMITHNNKGDTWYLCHFSGFSYKYLAWDGQQPSKSHSSSLHQIYTHYIIIRRYFYTIIFFGSFNIVYSFFPLISCMHKLTEKRRRDFAGYWCMYIIYRYKG